AVAPGLFPIVQDHPASVGSTVTAYLTGQGAVVPPVTATVGNRQATITSAGLNPDSPGLFQITLIVPRVAPGSHPLVITVNVVPSSSVSLGVSTSRSRMAAVGK